MSTNLCVVRLPGMENYAVITPGLILFGLGATISELNGLIDEARQNKSIQPDHEETPFSTIGLIPTFDCNQRCIYCYSRGGETTEKMPLETAKNAIKHLTLEHRSTLKIHLVGGGEPLLHKQWVFEIARYAKVLFPTVEFHIVSNGTFDEEVLQWIYDNQCVVRISYDGVMHEYQRPLATGKSSKNLVQSNIKALISHSVPVMVQSIVTSKGVETLRKTIDEVASLGVDIVKFEAARETDVSRFTKGIEPDPEKYAEALLDVISYVGGNYPDMMVDTAYFSEPSKDYYCGVSGGNKMLTPDGLITACLEVSRPADPYSDKLIFGAVRNASIVTDQEKLDYLGGLNYTNQIGGCLKCNLRLLCHGGCPMEGIWERGFPLHKSSYTCKVEHYFLPRLLLLLAENPHIANVLVNDAEVLC